MPVIIVATRTISKSYRKYLSNVPGKYEIKELQKTENCTHTSEGSNTKVKRSNIENSVIYTMNSNYRIAATLYYLLTCVISNLSANNWHKSDGGDDDDDDDDDNNNNNNVIWL